MTTQLDNQPAAGIGWEGQYGLWKCSSGASVCFETSGHYFGSR